MRACLPPSTAEGSGARPLRRAIHSYGFIPKLGGSVMAAIPARRFPFVSGPPSPAGPPPATPFHFHTFHTASFPMHGGVPITPNHSRPHGAAGGGAARRVRRDPRSGPPRDNGERRSCLTKPSVSLFHNNLKEMNDGGGPRSELARHTFTNALIRQHPGRGSRNTSHESRPFSYGIIPMQHLGPVGRPGSFEFK